MVDTVFEQPQQKVRFPIVSTKGNFQKLLDHSNSPHLIMHPAADTKFLFTLLTQ